MGNKEMTSATWLNCRMGLNGLLIRYEDLLKECIWYANWVDSEKMKTYYIENAKYWSQKYKSVIISINELKEF